MDIYRLIHTIGLYRVSAKVLTMTKMNKTEAIEYIEMVGYDHKPATEMVKDLPDEFDTDDIEIPFYIYDAIIEGIV